MSGEGTIGGFMQCHGCGCTDHNPCPGGCIWAGPNLCSACALGRNDDYDLDVADEELTAQELLELETLSYDGDPW